MPEYVEIVWWISLIIVLALVLVAWTMLNRLVLISNNIQSYAKRTLPSAVGIVNHTESLKLLNSTKSVAGEIIATAQAIDGVVANIEKKVGS